MLYEGNLALPRCLRKRIVWQRFRQRALEKSEAIEYYVGYPDELLNDTLVSEYYEDLNITDEDYFQNTLIVRTFYTNKEYKKLREPFDKKDWKRHSKAAYASAFYTHEENSISE